MLSFFCNFCDFNFIPGPDPVLNLQQTNSTRTAIQLSWTEPVSGSVSHHAYQIIIKTLNGETLIATRLPVATQNDDVISFDSSSVQDLPVATEFVCSVRTLVPISCPQSDETQDIEYNNHASTHHIECQTKGESIKLPKYKGPGVIK